MGLIFFNYAIWLVEVRKLFEKKKEKEKIMVWCDPFILFEKFEKKDLNQYLNLLI